MIWRRIFVTVLCLGVAFGLSMASTATVEEQNSEWNGNRCQQVDYAVPSFEEAKEIYQGVGWNEELLALEQAWYFADDSFDNETLHAVNTQLEQFSARNSPIEVLGELATTVIDALLNPWQMAFTLLLFLCVLLAIVYVCKRTLKGLEMLYALCALGGMLLMWAYLSFIGRFTFHVYRLTALQFIGILAILLTLRFPAAKPITSIPSKYAWTVVSWFYLGLFGTFFLIYHLQESLLKYSTVLVAAAIMGVILLYALFKLRKTHKLGVLLLCCCVVLGCFLPSTVFLYGKASDLAYYRQQAEKEIVIQQYAGENGERVYIRSLHSNGRRMTPIQKNTDPINLFCALDYLRYTDAYEEKLALNGLQELNIDSYFLEDVYYIGEDDNDPLVGLLLDYMQTQYGEGVTAEVVERLEHGIAVYQFQK